MKSRCVLPFLCLFGLLDAALAETIPNWAAPPFWQPAAPEISREVFGERAAPAGVGLLSAAASSPLPFIAITPCRVVDTRGNGFTGAYGPPALVGNGPARTFNIPAGPCPGIPANAGAYSINVAAILPASDGFMTVFPTGSPQPTSSDLNFLGGKVIANAIVAPAGTSGSIDVFVNISTHMILDINGYYAAAGVGLRNTFLGVRAGNFTMTGENNTGLGYESLNGNTTGSSNTAVGRFALVFNSTGNNNTAVGLDALLGNTEGSNNTGVGYNALKSNAMGTSNTGIGFEALTTNTSGYDNTGVGLAALVSNTVGFSNTAIGFGALQSNIDGVWNTGIGSDVLASNTDGYYNVGIGYQALFSATGSQGTANTAIGARALHNHTTGCCNIAIGSGAGVNSTTGAGNIYIDSPGLMNEIDVMRIGRPSTSAAFLGGIYSRSSPGGGAVYVNSDGKLGTNTSSRRFKEDVREIGSESDGLMRLRPVSFTYKRDLDPTGLAQYGLIAEEVAEVYPDLVAYGRDGQPETVRYHLINALLLNEVQKQHRSIESLQTEIDALKEHLRKLEARLSDGPRGVR